MAIRHEPEEGSESDPAAVGPSGGADPTIDAATPTLIGRGGDRKDPKPKRRSSQNATKHGVFATSPVIGDEREEDWNEHREGMRRSFQVQGLNEELLADQIARNRWQRFREQRWETEKLQLQLDGVDDCSRESIDPELMDLPEDEAAWFHVDAVEAQIAADLVREGDPDAVVPLQAAGAYVHAFERYTGTRHPRGWLRTTPKDEFPDLNAVTVGQILEGVDEVAKTSGSTRSSILPGIECEIRTALIRQAVREGENRRRTEIRRTDALVLSDADFALHERRVNFLDKEYDRLVQRIELSQRARGGALPPPIRIQRSKG